MNLYRFLCYIAITVDIRNTTLSYISVPFFSFYLFIDYSGRSYGLYCTISYQYSRYHSNITHDINLSISSGVVPQELKIARVIPIFKSGDEAVFVNYRPVSVLPVFSKLLEKVIYRRLYNFLTKYNILFNNQYGFRKNHSTALALIHLYDKLSSAIDNRKFTIGVFIDLSKAFDTVNHEILLAKLQHYGVRGTPLKWFKSYLSDREQFVSYNGYSSSHKRVKCGVPQGSILGPLLFLIYINDLSNVSKTLDFILFADDTNIFFSHSNLEYLSLTVNTELNNLTDWFRAIKLSVNIEKSNFMIFRPRQKRQTLDIRICLSNQEIHQVKESVFLGVVLDEHLTWIPHINNITRKVSKAIGIMYKTSFCLPQKALKTLYYALVYPYIQYCVSVWGSTYPTNLNRLTVLQKKAVRIVASKPFDAHTDPIFKDLQILKFNCIYRFHISKILFQVKNNLLPQAFTSMFSLNNQLHCYYTRTSKQFHIPKLRTNIKKFSISYQGPKIFNSLPTDIQFSNTLSSFTRKLFTFLSKNQ